MPAEPRAVAERFHRTGGLDGEAAKEFRLQFPHGVSAASARRAVGEVLQAWGLSDRAEEVLLVTTELVQNVTRHTTGAGELRLALCRAALFVEVTDNDFQPPVRRAPEPREIGGRGLVIVDSIARRWGYQPISEAGRPGKVVWAELALDNDR